MKTIALSPGINIPVLGLGTWQLVRDECEAAVSAALEIGYRNIDTAQIYGNQKNIARAIKNSDISRAELFITSKLWRTNHRYEDVITACKDTLDELETDYLDLYLIHWPNKEIPIKDTLSAMQELQKQGLIRAIGVSNCTVEHLQQILDTGIPIACSQIEFHPSLYQKDVKAFCDAHNITVIAYSPIAQGADLELAVIKQIAQTHNASPAQVIINWILSKNMVAIPKASKTEHLIDNWNALSWQLTAEEITLIDNIGGNNRIIAPDFAEF